MLNGEFRMVNEVVPLLLFQHSAYTIPHSAFRIQHFEV